MPNTLRLLPLILCLAAPAYAQSLQERLLQAEDARATTAEGLATLKEALQGGTRRTAIRAIGRIERPELIGLVAAAIHDGVGIRADELDRVTRKFFRGRDSVSGGSGLGLAIVDRIVNDHGGTMGIRSTEGQGTTVSVTIPAAH